MNFSKRFRDNVIYYNLKYYTKMNNKYNILLCIKMDFFFRNNLIHKRLNIITLKRKKKKNAGFL